MIEEIKTEQKIKISREGSFLSRRPRGRRPVKRELSSDGFDSKVLEIARVTRMTKGGRRFRFRAVVIVGNKAAKVGLGIAKDKEKEPLTYYHRSTPIGEIMTEKFFVFSNIGVIGLGPGAIAAYTKSNPGFF